MCIELAVSIECTHVCLHVCLFLFLNIVWIFKVSPERAEDIDFSHPSHGASAIKKSLPSTAKHCTTPHRRRAQMAFAQLRMLCPSAGANIKTENVTDTASEDETSVDGFPPVVYRLCERSSTVDVDRRYQLYL